MLQRTRARAVNTSGASSDRIGYGATSVLSALLLLLKTACREGLPGLALQACSFPMLCAALAWLSGHKGWGRRFYVAHRELLVLAGCLHLQWTVRLTALHGKVNTIDHHGGSALRLLGLLLGHTTALYGALSVLYARLVLPATGMLVAAMAATTLLNGERMCERVLESPGVEEPLSNLHSAMGFVLGLPAPPGVSTFLMAQEPSPMQQCKAVSAWLELAVGGALPYCILRWLEHKGRAAFAAQQRHGGQQRGQGPSSGTDADGSSPLWRDFLAHYLLCCTVWCILCIVF